MERFDSAYNVIRSDMEINNDRLKGKERINKLQIENPDNSSNGERDIMKSMCPFCGKNAFIVKKRKYTFWRYVLFSILFFLLGRTFFGTHITSPFYLGNKYHYICSNCKYKIME
jgi:hypothetical protein